MQELLKRLKTNNDMRQILTYLFFSLVVSGLEMFLGWLILMQIPERILIANTIALAIGAIMHYLLTTLYSFRAKVTVANAGVYAVSFLFALLLQNSIIFALYHHLLDGLSEAVQYTLSKVLSMLAALVITYLIRAWAHRKFPK